jgi:hypothetical protein
MMRMRGRQWGQLRVVSALVVLAGLLVPVAAAGSSDPVVAAVARSDVAVSRVGRLTMLVTTAGGSLSMSGRQQQKGTSLHMTLNGRAGGQQLAFEIVGLVEHGHFVLYMKSPLLAASLPSGKSWLKIDLQKEGAKLGVDFSSLLTPPTESASALRAGLVGTVRVGAETVAGAPATHYHSLLDLDREARLQPRLRAAVRKAEQLAGVRALRVPYDVWVGRDGRVRQVRNAYPGKTAGVRTSTTVTVTYLAYNVPVTISAPPAAQVANAG